MGNFKQGLRSLGLEATVEFYGVTVGEAAGAESGTSPVNRTAVNVGTVRVRSVAVPRPEVIGGG